MVYSPRYYKYFEPTRRKICSSVIYLLAPCQIKVDLQKTPLNVPYVTLTEQNKISFLNQQFRPETETNMKNKSLNIVEPLILSEKHKQFFSKSNQSSKGRKKELQLNSSKNVLFVKKSHSSKISVIYLAIEASVIQTKSF